MAEYLISQVFGFKLKVEVMFKFYILIDCLLIQTFPILCL